MTHTELVNATLVALSARGILCWSNKTGAGFTLQGNFLRFGLPGSSDILGCIPPTGRLLAVECKTGNATQRKGQREFEAAVRRCGGLYIVARAPADALYAIENAS